MCEAPAGQTARGFEGQTQNEPANSTAPCEQTPELHGLAQAINAEHRQAHAEAQSALEKARRCGELLLQAKSAVPHGQWLPWIEEHLEFGTRQAQKYLRLAEGWDRLPNTNSNSHLPSIDAALKALPKPPARPAKPKPIVTAHTDRRDKTSARHPALSHMRHRDPNREIERAICSLSGLAMGFDRIDVTRLDANRVEVWITEIKSQIAVLNRFLRSVSQLDSIFAEPPVHSMGVH